MKRFLALVPIATLGVFTIGCGSSTNTTQSKTETQTTQTKDAEKGGQLNEWEFPGAESHRSGNPGHLAENPGYSLVAADYATAKPFEEVWAYYAKKIGYAEEYKPNLTHAGGAGQHLIMILNSTNDPAVAQARRPSAKSATLIRRGADGNVTVFISRAKDEGKTYFTLIVEEKFARDPENWARG